MTDNPFGKAFDPIEEANQEAQNEREPSETEKKYLAAVEEMNKILDGRLESDLPLNDPYWGARSAAHAAHAKHKAAK